MNSEKTEFGILRTGYFECRWPHFNLKSGMYDCTLSCSVNSVLIDLVRSAFSINAGDGVMREDDLIPYGWSSREG